MRIQKGFTLIEILLVLVLLSVASVAVISTLPQKSSDEAKQQALALYHRLQLLNEEAILSGKDYGVHFDEKDASYQLLTLDVEGWEKLNDSELPEEVDLPDGIAMVLQLGGTAWKDEDRLFNPSSLFDEEMFADVEEEEKVPAPQVFIMSSGEVTPFSIAIYPQNLSAEQDAWHVVAKENGQIIILAPGESDEEA
ncbi:type II secretion system minor pseudopilin GspH [Vibrio japonicus]|uniref:Type II secretion system protein H n=1 Tax=Vibrio japonicus TaxID=1824638 RepID=A0ABY5LHH0_9VIBR|nr:type II secretion system minor pseudopilin GspH [Vibrio japonicus]UUM30522.1 type II secretion system minor pseudopilin GspH [Vibrio japonicus]